MKPSRPAGKAEESLKKTCRENLHLWILSMMTMLAAALLASCGGSSAVAGCGANCPPPHVSTWTWVSGSNLVDQIGVYSTHGIASPPMCRAPVTLPSHGETTRESSGEETDPRNRSHA